MKKHVTNLAGSNLYLDIYGNTVYYNSFDKNGYLITKEVEQKFRLFYYRYSIIVIALVLLGDYFNSFLNTLLVGAGSVILIELYFRFLYLKKLKCIKNFKRDKKTSKLDNIIQRNEKEKTVMKACAYVALAVLVVLNGLQQNFNVFFMTLSFGIAAYSLFSSVINFVAVSKMKI